MDDRARMVTPRSGRPARWLALAAVAALGTGCGRKEEAPGAPRSARMQPGIAVAATAPRAEAAARIDVAVARSTASDPVALWLQQLSSADPATRQAAALSLGLSGAAAGEAVAPLTDMLDDPNPRTRLLAAQALGRIGPDALPAFTRLEALAADETEADVRAAAATAVALLQAPLQASRVAPAPIEQASVVTPAAPIPPAPPADDFHVQVVREPITLGTRVEAPSVDDLLTNLRDESPIIRRDAAMRLGVMGSHASTRAGNVATIGRVLPPPSFGPDGENVIVRLGDVVAEDEDPSVRLAAATALARIGAPAEAAQADLETAATRDPDEAVRLAATQALGEIRRRY